MMCMRTCALKPSVCFGRQWRYTGLTGKVMSTQVTQLYLNELNALVNSRVIYVMEN